MSNKERLENIHTNLYNLTEAELGTYAEFIQKRQMRQVWQLFMYAMLLLGTGTTFACLPTGLIGSGVGLVFLLSAGWIIPVLWHTHQFLPFKLTATADQTIYNWRTRHSPEWMYGDYVRVGKFCLLFGDALATTHPATKPDL